MKTFAKLFLYMGLLYGAFMAVIFSLLFGTQLGVRIGIASGLIFGLCVGIVIAVLNDRRLHQLSDGLSRDDLGVTQRRLVNLALPYDVAFDHCVEAARSVKGAIIEVQDRQGGIIVAKVSANQWTLGEKISLNIKITSTTLTRVEVISRPRLYVSVVDFGKNLMNVRQIIDYVSSSTH